MNAVVVVHSHSTLVQFPFFLSFSRQSRLGKPICSLKGIKFLKNPHPIFFPFPHTNTPPPPSPPSFISLFVGEILVYWYCTVVEIWSTGLLSLCLVIGFCDWIVVIIRNLCWVLMIWSVPPVWQYLCCYTVLCSEGTFDWWLMFKLMPKLKLLLGQVVIHVDMINLASYFEWIIMAARSTATRQLVLTSICLLLVWHFIFTWMSNPKIKNLCF